MRLLILSADDFGSCKTVNETIEQLFRAGAITTAGIVAGASHTEAAAALAFEMGMQTGVQWSIPANMEDPTTIIFELESQLASLESAGVIPDHAATPLIRGQSFMDYSSINEVFMACAGRGLPLRMPQTFADMLHLAKPEVLGYIEAYTFLSQQILESAWLFNIKMPRMVVPPGLMLRPTSYEELKAGCLQLLKALPTNSVSVLCFRPCLESGESKELFVDWEIRAWENQLLTDPDFREAIEAESDIKLVNYIGVFGPDAYYKIEM